MYVPPAEPITPLVSTFSHGPFAAYTSATAAPSSVAYESAARAIYTPITLSSGCVIRRVWWANGATTTGGATIEVGVYADSGYGPGAKLVSGSATQGTANEVQFVDVTDTAIGAGLYWLALVSDITTNTTLFRVSIASSWDAANRMQEASASPLPSTATPVESSAANAWLYGFATTASP
jgi:hypothetical protein